MLKSMTGYGVSKLNIEGFTVEVELKTINSKFFDISIKNFTISGGNESKIRSMVENLIERGKVFLNINVVCEKGVIVKQHYNYQLFLKFYKELESLADSVNASKNDLFKLALYSPEVIISENSFDESDKLVFDYVILAIKEAVGLCNDFRLKEGEVLSKKIIEYIGKIKVSLASLKKLDFSRTENIRSKIINSLNKLIDENKIDKNRLEQEIIYYIEKNDIEEEQIRLSNHLDYFLEVIRNEKSQGKKLGFIAQEIGREINTIGSKANDAEIQKIVVEMKEELEKIKEQLLNIL